MSEVSVQTSVRAPVERVFASWNDEFQDIYKFNPGLSHSHILQDSPSSSGKGALRQCDMKDGKNWIREKVIGYQKNKQLVIDVYDSTMPVKSAMGTLDFGSDGPNQTSVRMTMQFEPKMGILGKLMIPMMKKQFASMLQELLDGNAAYVESGTQANETLTAA
ncbi:MAG: SRPBCC family protein [Pseudomonadota bacterium]